MKASPAILVSSSFAAAFFLSSCVEEFQGQGGSSLKAPAHSGQSMPEEKLTEHDAALRFLTAYIRLDRSMALKYATAEAVSQLEWNRPHGSNIPYYDDKMILYFNGGFARVYFQEFNGSSKISNFKVYRR